MQRMKLYSCNIILRLLLFLFPLGVAIYIFVMLSGMRIRGQQHVNMLSEQLRNRTFAQIDNTATMFLPLNYSASSLARGLSSSLNETQLPFTTVQSTVAPLLFLAFQTTPFVTQITYVGQDKLMFSFYTEQGHDDDQTFAVFCNSSSSATWYSQPVNRDTGMLYGQPRVVDAKEFGLETLYASKESLKGTLGYASKSSIAPGLNKAKKKLFFNTAAMDGRAHISMGFPVEYVDERFAFVKFYGVDFHLASNNGQVLVDTRIPDTTIIVYNGTVSVQLNNLNGTSQDLSGNQSCKTRDGERGQFKVKIKEKEFMFYCSVIELAGLKSVYTVAYTAEGMGTDVIEHNDQAYLLLVILFAIVKVSLCIFIIIVFKAASREMFLCAALIKQMESTHQEERKSISKSLAFAAASHDIRNGFANITCRIDHCLNEAASPDSDLAANLKLIDKETSGLVDILNDVLDASKVEAGKMPLKVEEFDLAELLENIVGLHYYRAVEKGADLILDPCDNSLAKFRLVKGDKVKIIQILNNLLMNAIKFTAEGHITVKATVRKPSKENALIVCNQHSSLNFLTKLRTKNYCCKTLNGFPAIQQNPNCMEFSFEVDDTGKGIPKEKQKDIFENFVQVKETDGEGGYGLGLGIVQSLVHLMGGEIKIVEKGIGERGTCFQFNIFLTACVPVSAEAEEQENNAQNHGLRSYLYHHFGLQFRSSPSRLEGCHVVLFLAGEERRKVISSHIASMHIKVLEVRNLNDLVPTLDRLKRKLDLSSSSLEKSEVSLDLTTDTTNEVHDHSTIPRFNKSSSKGSSNFILVIIDSRSGPLLELSSSLVNFKKDSQNLTCKFVLLQDRVRNCSSRAEQPQENRPLVPPPFDYVFQKPLHGKRLYEVLSLVPEYGNSSIQHARAKTVQEIECQEFDSKGQLREIVIRDGNKTSTSKDLEGKKVLVVDDQESLCMYNSKCIKTLGGDVDVCENGKEAFDKVCKSLNDNGANNTYDLILMDCEMPHMNGYEATRLIREVEMKHGMHIPIIALTAHTMDDEMSLRIRDAGMDYYLTKPLNIQELYAFFNRP